MISRRGLWLLTCFGIGLLSTVVFQSNAHGDHGHSHDEPAEPAHNKYSREANEAEGPLGDYDSDISDHEPMYHDDWQEPEREEVKPKPTQKPESKSRGGHGHDHHGHSHDDHGDHGHAHNSHSHSHSQGKPTPKGSQEDAGARMDSFARAKELRRSQATGTLMVWVKAILATALISAAPVVILFFIPIDNTGEHQDLLKVLLSFASGGLLGDAFLHLIPHAMSPHSHGEDGEHGHSHGGEGAPHDHSAHMVVGLWVLGGIVAFLVVEKLVRYAKGEDGHGHSHGPVKVVKKEEEKKVEKEKKDDKEEKEDGEEEETRSGDEKSEKEEEEGKERQKEDKKSDDKKQVVATEHQDIKVAGYLNLAADFTHNFTDGLAIGASFAAGQTLGLITTLTILFHEVPHEIGDFAILVQSGCSKKRAMKLQLTTAIGAMLGTIISLLADGVEVATAWVLPFTAGGFIYIGTVSVIPELLDGKSSLKQSLVEILALLAGVGLMVIIGMLE